MKKKLVSFLAISVISLSVAATASADPNFGDPTDLSSDCVAKLQKIRIGMSRSDVEKLIVHDGGVEGSLKRERYVLCPCKPGHVAKMTIDYKPVGVSDDIYFDANKFKAWMKQNRKSGRERGDDILARRSLPYCDVPDLR